MTLATSTTSLALSWGVEHPHSLLNLQVLWEGLNATGGVLLLHQSNARALQWPTSSVVLLLRHLHFATQNQYAIFKTWDQAFHKDQHESPIAISYCWRHPHSCSESPSWCNLISIENLLSSFCVVSLSFSSLGMEGDNAYTWCPYPKLWPLRKLCYYQPMLISNTVHARIN